MIHNKTNAEILKEFDKHVIGHTKAKKMLISLVNRSKTAHYHKYLLDDKENDIENMNCMLIGGSGTGKTYLVKVLQNLVDFPLVYIDATRLEPTGGSKTMDSKALLKIITDNAWALVGKDGSNYHSLQGTIDQTVVFIDEIDKLAKAFESSGNWNRQIQSGLLSIIESNEQFSKVSFILAGAFADLKPKESFKSGIGFNLTEATEEEKQITDRDIINYGLMPELVGRLNNITCLDTLEYEDMEHILNKVLLPGKIAQLSKFVNVNEDVVTKDKEKEIIESALVSGQGVRALKRELDTIFADIEFDFEVVPEKGV